MRAVVAVGDEKTQRRRPHPKDMAHDQLQWQITEQTASVKCRKEPQAWAIAVVVALVMAKIVLQKFERRERIRTRGHPIQRVDSVPKMGGSFK
jgi:hypothetical protein